MTIAHASSSWRPRAACRRHARAAPPSTSSPPPKTWPPSPARWAATSQGRVHRPRLPGPALRGGQAELRAQAQQGGPADRGRPRAGDRLAAAADPQSRNAKIQPGAEGYLDASLDREDPGHPDRPDHARDGRRPPPGQPALLARSRQRPPHREGHPAEAVALRPGRRRPTSRQRYADFERRLAGGGEAAGTAAMAPYKGVKVVTYHRSWPNFADRFGLDVMGYVEPRPGIPPSPSPHVRPHQGDEAPEREDPARRALLRSQDAELDRAARPGPRCWCCRLRWAA